jgi:hypothetical protein
VIVEFANSIAVLPAVSLCLFPSLGADEPRANGRQLNSGREADSHSAVSGTVPRWTVSEASRRSCYATAPRRRSNTDDPGAAILGTPTAPCRSPRERESRRT